jgi:D-3-phosphoglycerate dehydrogenase / 2-oxoglutarate reductase
MSLLLAVRSLTIGDASWSEAMAYLEERGHEVLNLTPQDLASSAAPGKALPLSDVEGLLVETIPVDSHLLEKLPRLRIVAKCGSGIDSVDVRAATARGIHVAATPGANAETVADHTFALVLALSRQIFRLHQATIAGEGWTPWPPAVGGELRGQTLGVVGTGFVGRAVIERARAFGMIVAAYDKAPDAGVASQPRVAYRPLQDVLQIADVVTIHLPLTDETAGIIGRAEFEQVKPGALFVNVSRGGVVDEEALADAVRSRRLAGAGIDVYDVEPAQRSALFGLDTVICTPHAAGMSEAAIRRARLCAAEAIRQRLEHASEA